MTAKSFRRRALRSSALAAALFFAAMQTASAADPTYQLDIPAGPLDKALTEFSQGTTQQIIFSADLVKGRKVVALHGRYTAEQALKILLSGTDLVAIVDANGVLMVRAKMRSSNAFDTEDGAALETVTVTAQRREEDSQRVPITMTTLSTKKLDTHRPQNLADVSRLVPGLLVSAFSENSPTIAIRGANNTFSQIGVSKPVQVVVNDVFVPRNSAAIFQLFDLESINVLEGPQGTLFGRNVTGGAIVIETRKPSFDGFGFKAEATAGNYDNYQLNGLVNVPINNIVSFNASASLRYRDGTGVDRLTGHEQDDINSQNYRASLRVVPAERWEFLFGVDYSKDDNGGRTLSSTAAGDDGDRRTSELGVDQGFDREIGGAALKAIWQGDSGTVTSITAYRNSWSAEDYSGVGANYSLLSRGSQTTVHDRDALGTFSQEVRYASPEWETGQFIAGVYYLNEGAKRQYRQHGYAASSGATSVSTLNDETVRTISYAGFIDGTWHILPTLDLSAGVRYTYDRKTASLIYTNDITASSSFQEIGRKESWDQLTPRAVLNWRPLRNVMAYASVTRGFTSGGFNMDASSKAAFDITYQPETVTSYEAGFKSQWLDDSLRVNASVFLMKYQDKQELVYNSTTRILDIINAARATAKGFEAEIAYKPFGWLELNASYAKLDTKYDKFEIGSTNNTGNRLSSAPPTKYALSANADYPLVGIGFLQGAINYSWIASYNTGAAASPYLQIPSYGLINANIGFETSDRRYKLTLWSNNLGNTDYILTRSTQTVYAEYLGEPRTYGVTLGINY